MAAMVSRSLSNSSCEKNPSDSLVSSWSCISSLAQHYISIILVTTGVWIEIWYSTMTIGQSSFSLPNCPNPYWETSMLIGWSALMAILMVKCWFWTMSHGKPCSLGSPYVETRHLRSGNSQSCCSEKLSLNGLSFGQLTHHGIVPYCQIFLNHD